MKKEFSLEGRDAVVQGRLTKLVHVDGDGYKFLADPQSAVTALRDSDTRADLFTFLQNYQRLFRDTHIRLNWII